MEIASIYKPIQGEMLRVKESLELIPRVDFPWLAELLGYILGSTGKLLRPALTLLAGKLCGGNLELLVPMATAIELLHTATLIHDDAVDNVVVRRGKPTVSSIWDRNTAVLAGDYLFAKSGWLVSNLGNVRVVSLFGQTIMDISSGELKESFSAYNWRQTLDHYFETIGNKTASLFSTATESGALLSQASPGVVQCLKSYGYNVGMAFQIVDDILDFVGEEGEMGKPVGSDLLQGTLTLPAILLIEKYPDDNPIKAIFENRDREANLEKALESIRNSTIIEDSYGIAADFCTKARQDLEKLPQNEYRQALLELTDYVVRRKR